MPERFSASVAARLIACPGSADLEKSIPGWTPPVVDPTKGQKAVGKNRHKWLQDASDLSAKELMAMAEALAYYAEIRSRRRFKVRTEEKIKADWLKSKPLTTADVVLYTADELHIIDWKWGKIPVDVCDNDQLLFYAVSYAHLAPKAKGAELHIIQPMADNMVSTYVSAAEIQAFMARALIAEDAILRGSTKLVPSDKGCMFCPAFPHSRSDKSKPLCPVTMNILYPPKVDNQAILDA